MAYKSGGNTIYNEASAVSTVTYNISTHGSLEATYSHLTNADLPSYAAMFYSPTEHEQVASIKYHNSVDYDSNINEVKEALSGPPLEAYIPVIRQQEGLGSASPKIQEKIEVPKVKDDIAKEIEEAQKKVIGKVVKIKETKQEIKIKRKIKKTEIELRK